MVIFWDIFRDNDMKRIMSMLENTQAGWIDRGSKATSETSKHIQRYNGLLVNI